MNRQLMTEAEAGRLILAARTAPVSGAVVELGTHRAGSTRALCEAVGDSRVHSFDLYADTPANSKPGQHSTTLAENQDWLAPHKPTLYQQDSVRGGIEWTGGPVAFLLVDTLHTYDQVVAEFEAWREHLCQNAVVCFHDHDARHAGVQHAVADLGLQGQQADSLLVVRYRDVRPTMA